MTIATIETGQAVPVADATAPPDEARVDLTGWTFPIDVRADFRQLFVDAWRMERDWFYDPNMHGLDWNAIREQYGQLVPHVAHRADLDRALEHGVGALVGLEATRLRQPRQVARRPWRPRPRP